MSKSKIRLKYPSTRRPSLVYTNDVGSINVAINHTNNPLKPNELKEVHKYMDSMMRKMQPKAKWFKSGIIKINGRKWFMLNFRGPAMDTNIRNIMVGTSYEGRMLMVSFNVIQELEEKWDNPGKVIIKSITVKD